MEEFLMNNRIYLVTGAAGFLGSHVCSELLERGDRVRALVLPRDPGAKYIPASVEVVEGNLCDMASLDGFFSVPEGTESYVIHCASMVTTNPDFNQKLIDVNVGGTKHMIEQCLAHPECKKMVYVSSTGAIPELPKGTRIAETRKFAPINPKTQVGCYSQSKALATQEVLDACDHRGLQACVVHPSGILGPDDHAISETTGTVIKIMNGEMSVGMGGSFNLCDVRDLAHGCEASLNLLAAMSALVELQLKLMGAMSPSFLIAMAGGISLMEPEVKQSTAEEEESIRSMAAKQ